LSHNQCYPRLLGDIGGTNARWAWQEHAGAALRDISVLPCQASATLFDSAANYLAVTGHANPQCAGIGIATAVTGDTVRMTNNAWQFSIRELQQSLGVQRCLVINDFTALAMSLTALGPADMQQIGGGAAIDGAPVALIGPGTGLGVSGLLLSDHANPCALSGEGGHVTVAAADDAEAALLARLRDRFSHVSAERVLSGPGLVDLYRAVCERDGRDALDLNPSDITTAAQAGSNPDCVASADYFASFLGNVAGNLALTLGARGGLYIGGGVVPLLGEAFNAALFRQRFEEKGRFQDYLQAIPTWLITASTPALVGASRALDLMRVA